jgi:histone deacetylase 1/2
MVEDQTAQEAWALITNLFLDNQMTRVVYLEAKFCGFIQGDLSITVTNFFTTHSILLRFSCPYTSDQNGKDERAIRTINDVTRTLLFQSSMPSCYWAEAVATATHLVNLRPSQAICFAIPYTCLHNNPPDYSALRVFGCLCYPNQSATAPHKLAPRSVACVFLGYPSNHKGYRCLDVQSCRLEA